MNYSIQQYQIDFTEDSIRQVAAAIENLTEDEMHFRLHPTSNSIAWDAWHIFRTVDSLVHFVFERDQPVWLQQHLDEKWNLPRVGQGTSMPPEEAWAMRFPPGDQLAKYGLDAWAAVKPRIEAMEDDYLQVIHTDGHPWGDRTRLFILGKIVSHSAKHLGYLAGAVGVLGRQGPSF